MLKILVKRTLTDGFMALSVGGEITLLRAKQGHYMLA